MTVLTAMRSPAINGIAAPRVFIIAGAENGARRLLDIAGCKVNQRLTNRGHQLLVAERGANFVNGDVHGRDRSRGA